MTNLDKQQETVVKRSLFQFVNKNIPGADLSVVDEIVLSYVISVLEEASQDPCFDVDGFIEMMSAYFPLFGQISSADVCSWLFQLESELSGMRRDGFKAVDIDFSIRALTSLAINTSAPGVAEVKKQECGGNKRVQLLSETSDCGSTDSSTCDFYSDECDILQEMFPDSSHLEVKHCITIANGDIERATQILLHRQESDQSIPGNTNGTLGPKPVSTIDDAELKNRIIARYSYVDKNAQQKEYKPVVPKVEPKKLVRYRDNKIVSLKGERYTEVRRDDEATELKKPKKPICP